MSDNRDDASSNRSALRELGRGPDWVVPDWVVAEYVCTAGPGDRPFEERRAFTTIAAVLEGTFTYTSDTGTCVLHPGALLLGNHGTCFECGHDHGVGDRCIAVHYAPEYFAEIAASVGGGSRFRFKTGMMSADAISSARLAQIDSHSLRRGHIDADEAIVGFLEAVVAAASATQPTPVRVSARDRRRIMTAVRDIDDNAHEPITLPSLAATAGMSKYHFLRTFRHVIGMTPYQLLLHVRLRRAAAALLAGDAAVGAIAFDAGFADLSTFNNRFRARFGESPTQFRRRARG